MKQAKAHANSDSGAPDRDQEEESKPEKFPTAYAWAPLDKMTTDKSGVNFVQKYGVCLQVYRDPGDTEEHCKEVGDKAARMLEWNCDHEGVYAASWDPMDRGFFDEVQEGMEPAYHWVRSVLMWKSYDA